MIRMRPDAAAIVIISLSCLSEACHSATIDYTSSAYPYDGQLTFYRPAQSFVAIDSDLISIGFGYKVSRDNPWDTPLPVTIDLYSGADWDGANFQGPLIASRTFTVPDPNGIFDTDFTGTSLTIGQIYTAVVSTGPWASKYQTVQYNLSDVYAGGRMFLLAAGGDAYSGNDLAFRVVGSTPSAVPEPETWVLSILGFGMIGGALRRRAPTRQFVRFA